VKCLLDTNVYLAAAGSADRTERFERTFLPLLPSTSLSAVVAYELFVNARGRETQALVQALVAPMRRAGRVVSPTFDDWAEAAEIVTAISEGAPAWRSKLPALLNDILIALCARRVGAMLFTYNEADFLLIRRHKDFALRVLSDETGR
jgi:predicted nucleic acid-binding protein